MTGAPGPLPRILLAVGAPDGMTRDEATRRYEAGTLDGISGISLSLIPWLIRRGHPFATVMMGSSRPIGDRHARAIVADTGGDVIVNLICDPDRQRRALHQLGRFELAAELPLVNPSWVVKGTTRPLTARRLAHQAGIRAPHCTFWRAGSRSLLEHVEAHGHRYPVLLRPPGRHGSEGLVRIDEPAAIAPIDRVAKACTVTDFVDFRSADGLWRKYRMIYAGDRLFRRHVLIDREWNLTRAARDFMTAHPQLVAEEEAWIDGPLTWERGSVEARVMHQFRALQLDFGAIDFALAPDGDLVVFEINACLQLVVAQRGGARRHVEANNDEILAALLSAICARADAPA